MQEEVANHVRKCPALRQLSRFENQAYYCKAINAGSAVDSEDTLLCEDQSSNSGGRYIHLKVKCVPYLTVLTVVDLLYVDDK